MDAELKAKWLEALESGKYKKGEQTLRSNYGNRYCCLGVLCDITHPGEWKESDPFGMYRFHIVGPKLDGGTDTWPTVPPPKWADEWGLLLNGVPETDGFHQENLIRLNDNNPTWDKVIEYIKEHL